MKNVNKNKKRKTLKPEIDACFNNYFSKVNKLVPFTTMADWPSHSEMQQSSAAAAKASDELKQALMAIKENSEKAKSVSKIPKAVSPRS